MFNYEAIIIAVVSLITGMAGFLFGHRKSKAEANYKELENVQMAIKIWREEAERLEVKVHHLEDNLKLLEDENKKLKHEIARLSKEVEIMSQKKKIIPKPKPKEKS